MERNLIAIWAQAQNILEDASALAAGYQGLFLFLSLGSGLLLMISILVTPWLITRLPPDYFLDPAEREAPDKARHPIWVFIGQVIGVFLFILGLFMLVLPGQGLLTIFASLFLIHFPGRLKLLRFLILRFHLLPLINRLRSRQGVPPIVLHKGDRRGR